MQSRDKFSPFNPKFESSLRASAYPEDLDALAAGMSDEEAIRRIGSRTADREDRDDPDDRRSRRASYFLCTEQQEVRVAHGRP